MTFSTSFYGIPAQLRSSNLIPLLIGPPGASGSVSDGSITNAKLANVATATFKGRTTAGTGSPEDLTATQATALLNLADGSLKGLMSASDFTKLAGVASGATANTGTVTTVSVVTANGVSGSVANAGTTPAITLTLGAITPTSIAASGQSLTGSQATSIVDLAATWNTTGTPTALKVNVTDTASASTSLLMDLQVGSTSQITTRKNGIMCARFGYSAGGSVGLECYLNDADAISRTTSSRSTIVGSTGAGIRVSSNYGISWSSNAAGSGDCNSTPDLFVLRGAAGTVWQRNSTNAQTYWVSGTYTDASNYRRVSLGMTTAGVAHIRPEGAGTGASGNVLHISGLPTSNPGPGILWNNAGSVAIGT